MGSIWSNVYWQGKTPYKVPNSNEKPTFDTEYGFEHPRQPRVSKISEQEMKALKLPKSQRDYCAHYMKDFLVCKRQYRPLHGLCKPELRAYEHCQYEDYVLRMKEYERERRLRVRALRKQAAGA